MICKHEQLRCTNNVFYCLKCGAEVPSPYKVKENTPEKENGSEATKRAVKRTTKKKGE